MTSWKKEYNRWLDCPALSDEEWRELDAIRHDDEQIRSRFRGPLEFGTAGLRGIMGAGIGCMNIHVIRWATQAFAQLIAAEGEEACRKGVCIAYDCRNHSEEYAREAACVCAANGVRVRLFDALRPTPELSFAILHYGAQAGINITASHNPREYNGYKVYWADGAQLPPRHAEAVARSMAELDLFADVRSMDFDQALEQGLVQWMGEETDDLFLRQALGQCIDRDAVAAVAGRFDIVYTPFHGAGHRLVPEGLRRMGLSRIHPVAEQMVLDGDFPTVESPNPENPEGFVLAVELAREVGSELIIGTDPDSDRVGVMALGRDGNYHTITGNQMGVLLLDYIIGARRRAGTMPEKPAALTTIVSTDMVRAVCEANGVHFAETFTGFKFMAEKLAEYKKNGSYEYLLAFEESYGYMVGDYVRDKDAVTASMLIAEMAAWYFGQNMTLMDALQALYEKYGFFMERTVNLVMKGADGPERMAALMADMRSSTPVQIAGVHVLRMRDYQSGSVSVPGLGMVGRTEIEGSNVLYFELEDGTSFIIRPSGTEPKVKVYILARGRDGESCRAMVDACEAYARSLSE